MVQAAVSVAKEEKKASEKLKDINVMLLGGICGKTSLLHRYETGEFLKNPMATMGVDYKIFEYQSNVGVSLQGKLWDTAG